MPAPRRQYRWTMPSTHNLLAFAAAAFAIIVVPGPSVLFIVSRGISLGRRAALATVVGNTAGALVQASAVALGLGTVVTRSIAIFTVVKLVGAVYLIWMGVQMYRRRGALAASVVAGVESKSAGRIVREGFVVGISNPKTTVFFAAVLPQFIDRHSGRVPLQMLDLGLVFAGIALVSDGSWALLAGTARRWLAGSPRRLRSLGAIGGATIIGLGARLALTGRHA